MIEMKVRTDENYVSAHMLLWEAMINHCRAKIHSG